jgi:hypothetical protein
MPDGSQQPPDPAAQRAEEQMRDWKEQHREGDGGGGWLGNVIDTVDGMVAAAEAGAFAVSPDTGQAIIKQLTTVQDQVNEMVMAGGQVALGQRLGGGYATQIATFNRQVTDEGPGKMLAKFAEELEQLKTAVSRSMANYVGTDGGARRQVDQSGGGL